jgi:hypothetical protein
MMANWAGLFRLAQAWLRRDLKSLHDGMIIAGAQIDRFHPSAHCPTTRELIGMARASRRGSTRA